MPVETKADGGMMRFRQTQPGKYKKFATKKMAPGIEAVIGIPEAGGSEVQSVLFDSKKFTAAQAKKWLADHDMKTGEGVLGIGNPGAWKQDARLALAEQYTERVNLYAMSDEDLLSARKQFCAAKSVLSDEFNALDAADRYTTGAGRQLLSDTDYYARIISNVEYEMASRHLMLD